MRKIYQLLSLGFVLASGSSVAYAQDTFDKIAFLCSDGIVMNGTTPGWNSDSPYVVNKSDDGQFRFSARFSQGTQTWLMFTDGIENRDDAARNASARIPDLTAAFADPRPEDLKIGNVFNSKYLAQAVGKPVPMAVAEGQGFQVGNNGQAITYNIVMSADLSTMTIESVSYPETLYLIGDATPGGWETQNATAMESLGNGVYRYEGELKAGDPGALQIYAEDPAVCGTDVKAYGLTDKQTINCWGVSNKNINYYETGRPGNCFYQIQKGETNNYILTVDVVNNTINVLLNNLYFADSQSGFTFVQMESQGNRVFTHKGKFNAGNVFTFAATSGWTTTIAPGDENATFGLAEYSKNTLKLGSGATMSNTYEGYYIVSADLNSMTLKTRTYNPDPVTRLYVASNGTYYEMTAGTDGIFTWTGALDGNFTVTTGTEAYPCYIPVREEAAISESGITDEEMAFNISDKINNSWSIGTPGQYIVTVNPTAMTVSVAKNTSTGIDGITTDEDNASSILYDLSGRRVQNPAKGIYIRVQGSTKQKIVIK